MTLVDPAKLCQIEIPVSNLDISLAFYENVLGWKRSPIEIHNYIVLDTANCNFGIALIPGQTGPRGGVTLYFESQDPERILGLVTQFGGKVIFGPRVLPGYGTIYQFQDPDGQRFGLFRDK
jgi:predicted enzyme related to lactoylglutathione lyase